ncbi:MAG: FISUMP domain-containing protein [Lentimicrobium sp.]|jgi:uncharacterized protein (TIGR02145 family)|nr:FISUMP domain-containing protein [Lentimicrobium sp.]
MNNLSRKIGVLIFMICFQLYSFGQSIDISFTGIEESNSTFVTLDSIFIRNVTQGSDTILYYPDTILSINSITGINTSKVGSKTFDLIQNYPNPFSDKTTFGIRVFKEEELFIEARNIIGQKLTGYKGRYAPGLHLFSFTGNQNSFYILTVYSANNSASIKLVNAYTNNSSQHKIKYIGYQPENTYFKNDVSQKNIRESFPFTPGDKLQYIGYSNGYQLSVLYDQPEESTDYVFEFELPDTFVCGDVFTDKRDGKTYETVQIGDQCWMAGNMNVGDRINGDQQQNDNTTIEKYCYDNDDQNCSTFGGLYQWNEMMQYDTNRYIQGVCPEGWHLPKISEWNELVDFAGGPTNAGAELKAGGSTGFDALMAGYRNDNGLFAGLGEETYYWTSVQGEPGLAYYNNLTQSFNGVNSGALSADNGYAVRCIKGLAPIINENVVVIDTTIYQLVSDSIELSQGIYIYQYNNKRKADDIILNDVIIGTTGIGYLRKVETLSDEPPLLTLETTQGTFEDIYEEAEFDFNLNLNELEEQKGVVGFSKVTYLADGVSLDVREGGFQYSFSDVEIYSDDNITFTITDGSVLFDPEFEFDFKFKNGIVQRLAFYTDESLLEESIDVEFFAQYSDQVLEESTLASYQHFLLFAIGPVPVLVVTSLDLNVVLDMTLDAELDITTGYTNTNYISLGAEYSDGQWSRIWDLEQVNSVHPIVIDGSINLAEKLSLIPSVSVMFYGVAGPYFNTELYEQFLMNMVVPSFDVDAELSAGLDANVGAEITIFGYTLASYNNNIYGFNEIIWNLPNEVIMAGGNGQEAQVNEQLPNPIKVRVYDNHGNTFSNIPVHFSIEEGGGSLSEYDVMTDVNGIAETYWTMGSNPGENTLHASVFKADGTPIDGSPVIFTATAIGSGTLPSVTTASITNITETTAQSGGNVTDDGGSTVTARGVCWNTSPNPTISNTHTTNGTGTGNYISNLTGLNPNTEYYVRAYATNDEGTAYGNQQVFTTQIAGQIPTVTTASITNITETTAQSGGNVTDDGGSTVTARGVCWNTSPNPTISNTHTTNGTGTGNYISNLTGLNPNTEYYVRAYATNDEGTAYGNQQVFTTQIAGQIPTVTTASITNITETTAQSGGNVTDDGGSAVTARGVCWNTSPNPTISNTHTTNGTGTGNYISNLTGLNPNTEYYVRAYATNDEGTAYGNQQVFTTNAATPTVTTTDATAITATYAQTGGNVTNEGGANVTAKGVCWDTSPNPDLNDNYTTDGSGPGSFISILSSLTPNTPYYVKAYATNTYGTTYGNQISFTTTEATMPVADFTADVLTGDAPLAVTFTDISTNSPYQWFWEFGDGFTSFTQNPTHTYEDEGVYTVSLTVDNTYGSSTETKTDYITVNMTGGEPCPGIPTFTYGGQVYNTVQIGTQCWMAENLNYGTTNSWTYNNDPANGDIYGRLYTWEAALTACPSGWHLPSDEEWKTMEMALGMSQSEADGTGWRGTDEGGKMKETGYAHWNSPNTGATNSSGFTALPGGLRLSSGSFDNLGDDGHWWSSSENSGTYAWYRRLYYDYDQVGRSSYYKTHGFSVRCLKNNGISTPTVTTSAISNITETTAESGGNVTDDGGSTVTARGVCWNTSPSPTISNNYTTDGTGTGGFTSNLAGLNPNTEYYVRAYATNSEGTAYGNQQVFTTEDVGAGSPCPGLPTITYGGQVYNTVQIETQCWLKENLNIGAKIDENQDMQDNAIIEKYCYNNSDENCNIYGGLYQWNEMMQYGTSGSGVQGICPDGWHIPTDEEWKTLEMALGMSQNEADNTGFRGTDEGLKMKSTDSDWAFNGSGTNTSGFTGRPAGYRTSAGYSNSWGYFGMFWVASDYEESWAWHRYLQYNKDQVYRYFMETKTSGLSVRCLKD